MANILPPSKEIKYDLDQEDELPPKGAFVLPGDQSPKTYLCGHSLGPLHVNSKLYLEREIQRWGQLGIDGYFSGDTAWLYYLEPLHEMMSKVVGALPSEVVIMNSLTTNIHLLLAGFYHADGRREKVLMESAAFGSDIYAMESHAEVLGVQKPIVKWTANAETGLYELSDFEDLLKKHRDSLSLIFLGGVNYLGGELLDIKGLTQLAHAYEIPIGFDLAHAAGNVELHLHEWGVDFAVWCTYKYLCGGPGSVGACYIHERHSGLQTHFKGWWGNSLENRFEMLPTFTPSEHAAGWQLSNPPLLALPSLKASLELFDQIGIAKIAVKSQLLANYLLGLLTEWEGGDVLTPKSPERHGAMISIKCKKEALEVFQAVTRAGFVVDYRSPHIIRVAAHGLYNTYDDCYRFAIALKDATK